MFDATAAAVFATRFVYSGVARIAPSSCASVTPAGGPPTKIRTNIDAVESAVSTVVEPDVVEARRMSPVEFKARTTDFSVAVPDEIGTGKPTAEVPSGVTSVTTA
jgi:hypothetical protein